MGAIDNIAGPEEERIRRLAYQLWEADSCREGRQDEYWYAARERLVFEAATPHEPDDPHPADEDADVYNPAPGGVRVSEQRDIKTNRRNPGSTY